MDQQVENTSTSSSVPPELQKMDFAYVGDAGIGDLNNDALSAPAVGQLYHDVDQNLLYRAHAILTEHDVIARTLATKMLLTQPRYQELRYGEADYFAAWEAEIRRIKRQLRIERGPPKYRFDGASGEQLEQRHVEPGQMSVETEGHAGVTANVFMCPDEEDIDDLYGVDRQLQIAQYVYNSNARLNANDRVINQFIEGSE